MLSSTLVTHTHGSDLFPLRDVEEIGKPTSPTQQVCCSTLVYDKASMMAA